METQSKEVPLTGGYVQPQVKPFLESRTQAQPKYCFLLGRVHGMRKASSKIRLKSQSNCKSNVSAISCRATGSLPDLRQVSLCPSSTKVKCSTYRGRPETQTSSSKWLETTRQPGTYIFPLQCWERTQTQHTILAILHLSLGSVRPKYPGGIKPSILQTSLTVSH